MSTFWGGLGTNEFHIKSRFGTHSSWKKQNPGVRFGDTSWTALPIQPILPDFLIIGPNWQCCSAGSYKTAHRILIFFNCYGCQTFILYEIHCFLSPPKSWNNNSFQGSVEAQLFVAKKKSITCTIVEHHWLDNLNHSVEYLDHSMNWLCQFLLSKIWTVHRTYFGHLCR